MSVAALMAAAVAALMADGCCCCQIFNKPKVAIADYLSRSPVCTAGTQTTPHLIKEGFPLVGETHPGHVCGAECSAQRANATLMVNFDPNGGFGNCGMQLWRSGVPEQAADLLSEWWNMNDMNHNLGFPWEQFTFNHWLWPKYENQVKIIEDTDEFSNPMFCGAAGFLKHVVSFQDITHPGTRKHKMLQAAETTYGLSIGDFQDGYTRMMHDHHTELSSTQMEALSEQLAKDTSSLRAMRALPAAESPTKWADLAYQLKRQDGYDQVMAVPVNSRKRKYMELLGAKEPKSEIAAEKQEKEAGKEAAKAAVDEEDAIMDVQDAAEAAEMAETAVDHASTDDVKAELKEADKEDASEAAGNGLPPLPASPWGKPVASSSHASTVIPKLKQLQKDLAQESEQATQT